MLEEDKDFATPEDNSSLAAVVKIEYLEVLEEDGYPKAAVEEDADPEAAAVEEDVYLKSSSKKSKLATDAFSFPFHFFGSGVLSLPILIN